MHGGEGKADLNLITQWTILCSNSRTPKVSKCLHVFCHVLLFFNIIILTKIWDKVYTEYSISSKPVHLASKIILHWLLPSAWDSIPLWGPVLHLEINFLRSRWFGHIPVACKWIMSVCQKFTEWITYMKTLVWFQAIPLCTAKFWLLPKCLRESSNTLEKWWQIFWVQCVKNLENA